MIVYDLNHHHIVVIKIKRTFYKHSFNISYVLSTTKTFRTKKHLFSYSLFFDIDNFREIISNTIGEKQERSRCKLDQRALDKKILLREEIIRRRHSLSID